MDYCVIAFSNTHSAMLAQKLLASKIKFDIMPTLRNISQSCGISIKFCPEDLNEASSIVQKEIEHSMYEFYGVKNDNGKIMVEPLNI